MAKISNVIGKIKHISAIGVRMIIIFAITFTLTTCTKPEDSQNFTTLAQEETENYDNALCGVWEYTSELKNGYRKCTFAFDNKKGYYTEDSNVGADTYLNEHIVFEYCVNGEKLEILTQDGLKKSEQFTVTDNAFTYQGITYLKNATSSPLIITPNKEDYEALLNGEKSLVESYEYVNIFTAFLRQDNTSYMGEPEKYTTLDLDRDGINELLVQYSLTGDILIIHWDSGLWRGYYAPLRQVLRLKADGTIYGSGGAAAGGYYRIEFKNSQMKVIHLTDYDETEGVDDKGYYSVDGIVSNKSFYDSYIEEIALNENHDIVWADIK